MNTIEEHRDCVCPLVVRDKPLELIKLFYKCDAGSGRDVYKVFKVFMHDVLKILDR